MHIRDILSSEILFHLSLKKIIFLKGDKSSMIRNDVKSFQQNDKKQEHQNVRDFTRLSVQCSKKNEIHSSFPFSTLSNEKNWTNKFSDCIQNAWKQVVQHFGEHSNTEEEA